MSEKRKYKSLTNGEKEEIKTLLGQGESSAMLAGKYGVNLTTIYRLKTCNTGSKKSGGNFEEYKDLCKRKRMRLPKYAQVDKCLFYWFRQIRDRDLPVTGDMLLVKAEFFNKEIGGDPDWKPSNGFLRSFKNRYGIKSKQLTGEIASGDSEAAEEYARNFSEENQEFDDDCQYNADEFGLEFRTLPSKSLVGDSDKCQVGFSSL